jgi:hypothetical protein
VASDLRRRLSQAPEVYHFIPLYFGRATPEAFLDALEATARRDEGALADAGPEIRQGVIDIAPAFESGTDRRLLQDLVRALRSEWGAFYKQYWQEQYDQHRAQYDSIQTFWDQEIQPSLGPYLGQRRLRGGLVMPSPSVGPEGRITERDPFDAEDQVVAVQFPRKGTVEASTFAFLKELCFLIIDDSLLSGFSSDQTTYEDLQRTMAVRCGAMLLEFYAPVMASRYRRAFLDAVGAEESYSVAAFERVYPLDPELVERLRNHIRRDR